MGTPATFSPSSEWRLFYVILISRFNLVAFGSNLTAWCVVSLTFFSLCNRKKMANMFPLTDKNEFYLSFRIKGVEADRKSWRGIGLDGSLAGQVDCDHQNRSGFVAIYANLVCECDCFENNFRAIFATIHISVFIEHSRSLTLTIFSSL